MHDVADRTDPSPADGADTPRAAMAAPARLAGAVDLARAAAVEAADGDAAQVGEHLGVDAEPDVATGGPAAAPTVGPAAAPTVGPAAAPTAATHRFEAAKPGYRGWCWAVTLAGPEASGDDGDAAPTVSEVVLLPGPAAVTPPAWVPWNERVRAEDLSPGDLLPVEPDDERLVPAHAAIDDDVESPETDEIRAVADELALGRPRVMSPEGRFDAGVRWSGGDFGPGAEMARSASAHCGTCGFYLSLSGSLRAAFGVCGNAHVPADGRVVHVEYGCGGHSEMQVDTGSAVAVADLVYDDGIEMETAGTEG